MTKQIFKLQQDQTSPRLLCPPVFKYEQPNLFPINHLLQKVGITYLGSCKTVLVYLFLFWVVLNFLFSYFQYSLVFFSFFFFTFLFSAQYWWQAYPQIFMRLLIVYIVFKVPFKQQIRTKNYKKVLHSRKNCYYLVSSFPSQSPQFCSKYAENSNKKLVHKNHITTNSLLKECLFLSTPSANWYLLLTDVSCITD